MPISNPLTSLFGKSPIKPMQRHMEVVRDCAAILPEFFEAVIENDWQRAAALHAAIAEKENEADVLKKNLRLHLPNTLFMPVARSDLLELLRTQDKVANCAKDISGLMLGREMSLPETLQDLFKKMVATVVAVVDQALTAINELDELLETSFGGREASFVITLIEELDKLEDQADRQERELRHALFEIEKTLPPVDVMFLYQTIDNIGELANYAERVGSRLQLLLAR